jgi:medium-chain acyl-[acyl-carrier-protein] hydrolase
MTTATRPSRLVRFRTPRNPAARLICVPYAGGGAAAFRAWGSEPCSADVDVQVAQFPGRESRISEAPLARIDAMVDHLLPVVAAQADLPYALYGHSMGALVAYELARALCEHVPRPVHLFVSATCPPRQRDNGLPKLHGLPDDEFLFELNRRYGGIPAAVLEQRDLMQLLMPMLRADVTALEMYEPGPCPPLDCPITALAGTRDARASATEMAAWRSETSAAFRLRVFDGGHFFINEHRLAIMGEVARVLPSAGAREVVA